MTQNLFENWAVTKDALTDGLTGNKKVVMESVLENTKNYLSESALAGSTMAGNVASLNKVILPVIRRVMPTVIANEIIGVQPMTGPVGQIHTLRVRYADNAAGVTAGQEALSPFDIAKSYSGADGAAPAATAAMEGTAGNRMSIQVMKQTVEAKTRKLSARWTFEAAQDAQSQHGIDVEAEIMAALAQEITAEIDQEILSSLTSLAGTGTDTYNQAAVSGTATFVGDEHAALAVLAAIELGVSVQEISERLPRFRPSTLRGRCFQGRGRSYLVDCYNANPASMMDSIEFFRNQFPDSPKLYVLAGMEELGKDGKNLHHSVGQCIVLDPTDLIILIGEKATWMAPALLENGYSESQIIVLAEINDAISLVEDFDGAILFKGSRSYQLEKLLPAWAVVENENETDEQC